ncbi:MAG: 1-acyl-sn-glycerol-3-phosphate acyltransferase [Desulfobulbaceae bacterium]|nr:1-acyl-sn-glycerol-3-phosphate acyltransferase [Desulfobulbaceae bacterium]
MHLGHLLRGWALLILAPVLTIITSIAGLAGTMLFGMSASSAQRFPRLWAKILLAVSGVTVTIKGGGSLANGNPYIFAGNHQSQFDIFVLQGCLDHDFRWLAKQELFEVPVFGAAMRRVGYIPVDRTHSRAAVKSLDEAAQRIAAGTSVIIFPEGTRSGDGELLPFKSGAMVLAIKAGVPVVPMAIVGTHAILPKGRLLAKPGKVVIRLGEPIETSGYKASQKHELAERLQAAVAALIAEEKGGAAVA